MSFNNVASANVSDGIQMPPFWTEPKKVEKLTAEKVLRAVLIVFALIAVAETATAIAFIAGASLGLSLIVGVTTLAVGALFWMIIAIYSNRKSNPFFVDSQGRHILIRSHPTKLEQEVEMELITKPSLENDLPLVSPPFKKDWPPPLLLSEELLSPENELLSSLDDLPPCPEGFRDVTLAGGNCRILKSAHVEVCDINMDNVVGLDISEKEYRLFQQFPGLLSQRKLSELSAHDPQKFNSLVLLVYTLKNKGLRPMCGSSRSPSSGIVPLFIVNHPSYFSKLFQASLNRAYVVSSFGEPSSRLLGEKNNLRLEIEGVLEVWPEPNLRLDSDKHHQKAVKINVKTTYNLQNNKVRYEISCPRIKDELSPLLDD